MPYRLAEHQHTPPSPTVTVSPRRTLLLLLRRVVARRADRGRAVTQGARA